MARARCFAAGPRQCAGRAGVAVGKSRAGHQRVHHIGDLAGNAVDGVTHPEAEIDRDLVVAAARGVQALARFADAFGQPRLDIHVDVFERAREGESARRDLVLDAVEPLGDRFRVGRLDNALFGEHGDMGARASYVLLPQGLVEFDRGVDIFHDGVGSGLEPSAPHFIAHRMRSFV